MQKYLKLGFIFIVTLLILIILNNLLKTPIDVKIKKYLLNSGYVIDSEDDDLLHKYMSGNTINYFSLADYTLNQSIEDSNKDVSSSLSQTYDYKEHVIKYNYHANYANNTNIIIRGEYKDNEFTCNKEFSSTSFSGSDISNTCGLIKIKVERFNSEANVLFNNYEFIEYMESVEVD